MPLVAGQEEAWVQAIYESALGRDAEEAGRKAWAKLIDPAKPKTLATVAAAIASSLEAKTRRVAELYDRVFRREADEEGLIAWAKYWDAKRLKQEQIEALFYQSEEFLSKLPKSPKPVPEDDATPVIPVPKKTDEDGEVIPPIPRPKGGW